MDLAYALSVANSYERRVNPLLKRVTALEGFITTSMRKGNYMIYTNNTEISLSLAVWLVTSDYDYIPDQNYISATGLLKPIRQLILNHRADTKNMEYDISNNIPTNMGSAIHSGIENAWKTNYANALRALGYPKKMIERVVINPKPEELKPNSIPVYMEQRAIRKIGPYQVGGKYDFVGDGILEDFKSQQVYGYMKGDKDDDYILQGSIYRWLNPEIITADFMRIQCIFTDWSKLFAMIQKNKGYPQSRLITKKLQLMPIDETEQWIKNKLAEIRSYRDTPEADLPECTPEELWRTASVYKYYKNPSKTTRSTANFDDYHLAHARLLKDGSVGIIKEIPGQVKRCAYCNGFEVCTQKDQYIADGTLVI